MNRNIDVVRGFQTSVNIAFDLYNDDKIKNFIPTMSSIEIIEDVFHSIFTPNSNRARLLVGAYGRGKSHIILVLMSLLFRKDDYLYNTLLSKMQETNPKLYELTIEYFKSDIKLLPVIINGNSANMTQSFLNALQQALKNANIEDIMPETNFIAAANAITRWKTEYPETYKKFCGELNEPVDDFIYSLTEFDVNTYEQFIQLFPKLTSGSEFNPFVGFNVTEVYDKVIDKLGDKKYTGVYIIYDEFSKYLESSIAQATVSDTKLLQDFAEKCDRSGDKQIHLMLISHKDIANYIDNKLPKEKVDGWRGVSGRFKHVSLHNNFSQMYEIISAVIKKEQGYWNSFTVENKQRFDSLKSRFIANNILEDDIAEVAVLGCYPLHPISTFILPRLSEKVAQNERTLFTFLSAEHKYTLTNFLEIQTDDFNVLTPDYIFDYFDPLLKKEHYTTEIHRLYKLTLKVLSKLDPESLGAKIIKTIALIYVIEQFEKLPPTYDIIIDTFIDSVEDIKIIENTLEYLIEEECIVYLKRSNGYLKIKESSGVDIQSEIVSTIERVQDTLSVKTILNNSVFENYMYPTAYNDEMEITRYFDFVFIDSTEFFDVDNWELKIEGLKADGVVYAIIPKSTGEINSIKKKIRDCNNNRILFIVPKGYSDIEQICYEYCAVNMLKESAIDDELLSDEYEIIIEDLEEVIGSFVFSYLKPELGNAEYFHNGKRLKIRRKAQVSAKLSEICYETYPNTPIINNESINKDVLPTMAINSRNKLIAGLLENELDINLGLTGTGQDVSFMRSTLIQTGILINETEKPEITLTPDNDKMMDVLSIINDFFSSANNQGRSFKELYDILTLPRHGYGLKKGVLPILIAAVLNHHKKYIVITNRNEEVKITPDLFNSINEMPESYSVFMESWSEEKSQYIDELAALFSDYVYEKEKDYNTFLFIVLAMNRWYMGLPKYAKELKEVYKGKNSEAKREKATESHIKFLNSLKSQNINAREYLFDKLFDIYGYKQFTVNIVDNIIQAKELFDGAKNELIVAIINDVKDIFSTGEKTEASLTSIIKDWYEKLKSTTVNHLYSNDEDKVLQLMGSINNDEKTFIERLAKTVTGLRIDDWNETNIEYFNKYLEELKKTITEFDRKINDNNTKTNIYKLSFINESGIEVERTFEKAKYTKRAEILLNAIITEIEEMGESISEQEKRQVLMDIIEKMCT